MEITKQLLEQLEDLKFRAKRIDYKNTIPSLPKKPTESTMSGFYSRLNNWRRQLEVLEKERINESITKTDDVILHYLTK